MSEREINKFDLQISRSFDYHCGLEVGVGLVSLVIL